MKAYEADHYLLSAQLKTDDIPGFDEYPFCLPAVASVDGLEFHPNCTFIIGENGSGKSTVLEALAIAMRFNAEGGTQNFHFDTRPSHSELHRYIRPIRSIRRPNTGFFLRAESFYNLATEVERLGLQHHYGEVSLHEQSHGEAFFSLMQHRFGEDGLYILDEPEAALSPARQMAMISLIHQLVQRRCQFIIATHSPIILAYPNAWIYEIRDAGLERVAYEDTDTFSVTKQFLSSYNTMLPILMED